ncbi:hypothetical protein GCM10009332_01290 [Shewanella gelidii]|uniref:EAL domain-containing protein n=2 Tax=Shewanella gelidii TaxID=1642821 RepID=A0A917N7M8_9GAMM|nr:hypothetical protein GCM10009332_01290 [Shewanella gelidii]
MVLYLMFVITFTQGMGVLQKENFHQAISTFQISEVSAIDSQIAAVLFLENEIVKDTEGYYAVLSRQGGQIQAVKIRDIFSKVMLFSNLPLLLVVFFAFVFPYYMSSRAEQKTAKSLGQVNEQADKLLSAFSIELAEVAQQNPVSKLSYTLNALNDRVLHYQRETETNIFQDKLTGLADRHAYLSYLEIQLARAEEAGHKQALLFVDLDGFKQVNDSFGHSFGDEVLIQVAGRLMNIVRNHDLSKTHPVNHIEQNLSRLGGDEFSVFIEHLEDEGQAIEIAQSILQEMERDFLLGNKVVKIGASIGIAVYPDSASNPNTLLQMADVAMFRAKTDGRGIFRVYSPEMGSKMRRYHYLLEEMRLALATQNFSLSFQPIVHVEDCSIDYFESLVRWNHPAEGMITPGEFIPIAEESNLILELGDWILFEACRQMAAWYNAGMRKVRISVNISAVQLKHRRMHQWVMQTIDKAGLPPSALLLEITESCFIDAPQKVIEEFEKLREDGVQIAIDDFGTGFSSLSTLAELPIDVIKVDKLFIDQANVNPKYDKILNSISELGQHLNLKIVAEGVEQAQQFELVKKLGIQCVQGYLISRPETSRNVGSKVLNSNFSQVAQSGTNVWQPQASELPPEQTSA